MSEIIVSTAYDIATAGDGGNQRELVSRAAPRARQSGR